MKPCLIRRIVPVGLMMLHANAVLAQNFPIKPVRIVTQQAGGTSDFSARVIAQAITGPLNQPVVVENYQPIPSIDVAHRAAPDGYTMLYGGSGFMFGPLIRKASYDPLRDFAAITILVKAPNVLVVHPSLPVKTVKELIALAKARPGELNYSSGTTGGSNHLANELFKSRAGVNIVRVPYSRGSEGITALLSGETQLTFSEPASVLPLVKTGKLRALAITSPESSSLYPGLPTMAESGGLPGYEMVTIDGMWVPAATPAAVITRLNQELVRALNTADVKAKLSSTGVEVVGSTPEELTAKMKADIASMAKVIKEAGIRVE